MAIESCRGNVPDCFVEAYRALLAGTQQDVRPTPEDMREALAHVFELDAEAGWVRATSPTGSIYSFDMKVLEDVISVKETAVEWLVWLTLMSLAGLEDSTGSNEDDKTYVRTLSDGLTTLKKSVESMFFKD